MNVENIGKTIAKIVFEGDKSKSRLLSVSAENENCDEVYTEMKLTKPKEHFQQIPTKQQERSILYITGASGSGKSYYTRAYADEYHKLYPHNPIYLISSLNEDSSIDKVKTLKRVVIDDKFLSADLDASDFKDSLTIFDDTDCLTDKTKRVKVNSLLNALLETGRHHNCSVIYTSHVPTAGLDTKRILNEAHSITIFPHSLGGRSLKYLLENYLGFDKQQIKKLKKLSSRWVTIIKTYPMVVLSEKEAFKVQTDDD